MLQECARMSRKARISQECCKNVKKSENVARMSRLQQESQEYQESCKIYQDHCKNVKNTKNVARILQEYQEYE